MENKLFARVLFSKLAAFSQNLLRTYFDHSRHGGVSESFQPLPGQAVQPFLFLPKTTMSREIIPPPAMSSAAKPDK